MTPLLFFAAAAAVAQPADEAEQFKQCATLAQKDPKAAVETAQAWRLRGGDISARQCLGLAYMALDRAAPAALTFEQAARAAETVRDPRVTDLWGQAGNAWLAAGDAAKARTALDTALARGGGSKEWQGELYIDRARSDVELNDLAVARTDLDKALALVPDDPMGWLLSATLARRARDLARAAKDIVEAMRRAPDDPSVALEAGNIAALQGDIKAAREEWSVAASKGAGTPAGKSAEAALAANPAE